jgi:hypothetical protein
METSMANGESVSNTAENDGTPSGGGDGGNTESSSMGWMAATHH